MIAEATIIRADRLVLSAIDEPSLLVPLMPQRASRWPAVRDLHLAEHPECAVCGGRRFVMAHHVEPYHLRPDLELDPSNLLTLCEHPARRCHFVFGHLMDWRCHDPRVRDTARMMRGMIQRSRERMKGAS